MAEGERQTQREEEFIQNRTRAERGSQRGWTNTLSRNAGGGREREGEGGGERFITVNIDKQAKAAQSVRCGQVLAVVLGHHGLQLDGSCGLLSAHLKHQAHALRAHGWRVGWRGARGLRE